MARRRQTVTIPADAPDNRDAGKSFEITEMSAKRVEDWAGRLITALIAGGVTIPDETAKAGLAGVASMGMSLFNGLNWDTFKPLLDDMMPCIQYYPDPNRADVLRGLVESDIEEVSTYLKLRVAWLELHTGFSLAAKIQSFMQAAKSKMAQSNMSMSPA